MGDKWPLCTFGIIRKWSLNISTFNKFYRDDISEFNYVFIGVTLVCEA